MDTAIKAKQNSPHSKTPGSAALRPRGSGVRGGSTSVISSERLFPLSYAWSLTPAVLVLRVRAGPSENVTHAPFATLKIREEARGPHSGHPRVPREVIQRFRHRGGPAPNSGRLPSGLRLEPTSCLFLSSFPTSVCSPEQTRSTTWRVFSLKRCHAVRLAVSVSATRIENVQSPRSLPPSHLLGATCSPALLPGSHWPVLPLNPFIAECQINGAMRYVAF